MRSGKHSPEDPFSHLESHQSPSSSGRSSLVSYWSRSGRSSSLVSRGSCCPSRASSMFVFWPQSAPRPPSRCANPLKERQEGTFFHYGLGISVIFFLHFQKWHRATKVASWCSVSCASLVNERCRVSYLRQVFFYMNCLCWPSINWVP